MKKLAFLIMISTVCFSLYAQDLTITTQDLRLELRPDGGFHLFIRKKPDIYSVLITESTRDPAMQSDNYAYRAGEWNAINGNEIRLLNGIPIPAESRVYSLVSSTVVNHNELGEAFHIYIPYILYYGYEGVGRHGEVYITDGTYLNIRAFELPYADYRGTFKDNPFVLEARQESPPEGNYIPETREAFEKITKAREGRLYFSINPEDVTDLIYNVLEREKGKVIDIVLCIDTTNSMKKYIDPLRARLVSVLQELVNDFPSFRIGMVLYRDYNEAYLTRRIPFTSDFTRFQRDLNAIRVGGGGDIPEAVYEALHDGAIGFTWEAESRIMILIGDGPPHPRPRGRITWETTEAAAEDRNITIHAIILPQ